MKKIMFNTKLGLEKAVLEGRKTQTRRIVSESLIDEYDNWLDDVMCISVPASTTYEKIEDFLIKRSKYVVGEVVAVAQSYKDIDKEYRIGKNKAYLEYLDSMLPEMEKLAGWNNKMFVKASLCPNKIKITNVRIERLQGISDDDCLAEGITEIVSEDGTPRYYVKDWKGDTLLATYTPQKAYSFLIDKVGKKGDWNKNPYVYVYDFELVK